MRYISTVLLSLLVSGMNCRTPQGLAQQNALAESEACSYLASSEPYPSRARYVRDDGQEMLVFELSRYSYFEVEKSRLSDPRSISTQARFDDFMQLYERICNRKPSFVNEIAFVRMEKERKAEEAKAKHRLEGESLLAKLLELRAGRADSIRARNGKRTQLEEMETRLARMQPESFLISGQIMSKESNGVLFVGNAIPSGRDMVSAGAMAMSKGYGFLKEARPDDIVLGQQVFVRTVYFRGIGAGVNRFGVKVQVNLYAYEPDDAIAGPFNALKRDAEKLKTEITELSLPFREHDQLEERIRKEYKEISIPEAGN